MLAGLVGIRKGSCGVPSKKLKNLPFDRAIILKNITCPYCGDILRDDDNTKEHVIGRRFIPKGKLDGCWNLIVRACEKCNSDKSHLENDISAITLAGKLWFSSDGSEEKVRAEAQRKSKSVSKKTGKSVLHSQEELNFEGPFPSGVTIKCSMVGPPQIEGDRLYELARLQMMAFFYFITFNCETNKGGFWPVGFHPLSVVHYEDWGNSLQKAFMSAVANWEPRLIGNTADGYFRSIIRRHPSAECWSWAVEWNKNYRVVGFFGSRRSAEEIVKSFQPPEMTNLVNVDNLHLRYRSEVKLAEEDDLLFVWDDENA